MTDPIQHFKDLVSEIYDVRTTAALLDWDQQTMMPTGGAEGRAYQMATLMSIAHRKFTSAVFGEALEAAEAAVRDLDPDSDDTRHVMRVKRDYVKQVKVPAEWVNEFTRTTSIAQQVWQHAKPKSDFEAFKPHLQRIVELRREYANFFQPYDHIYDPLLDDFEPGMKSAHVVEVFTELRKEQAALVQAIAEKPQPDGSILHQSFSMDRQRAFGEEVIRKFGYDFDRGRQDMSAHPFTTSFGLGDVRITTRFQEDFLSPALFATMHEAGHAIYEQGIKPSLARSWVADGASLGIHESQSRLWENLVGRSRPFWSCFYPKLRAVFPDALGQVDEEMFFRAVNKVEPSLIRVEADEATYNLHIMLRFELERALLEDDLTVDDLPQAWNDRFEAYLGIRPPDHAHGVLQDVHWSGGSMGYFPTYALGNLIAAQWWEKILEDVPDVEDQIAQGEFGELLKWLRQNIHQHGAKFMPDELIQRVTGKALSAQPYIAYLKSKFGALYGLT